MKLHCPPGCHKCCELFTFVTKDDFDRWLEEDRLEILACLTWQRIHGRKPMDLLFIPQKRHIVGHGFLKKFYKDDWKEDSTCVFLNEEGRCSIYKTRPEACRDFPRAKLNYACPGLKEVNEVDKAEEKILARDKLRKNMKVYENRELLSKVIRKSKEQASLRKIASLFGYKATEAIKEEDDERKESVRTAENVNRK